MSRQRLHFIHVGKTGGTAIKAAIRGFENEGDYQIVVHDHRTRFANIPTGEKCFFFLRDPISRFVSGFNSRLRKGQPRYSSQWSREESLAFARFHTPNALASALSGNLIRRLQARHAFRSIQHLESYRKWFGGNRKFSHQVDKVLFIGFQESLDEDFRRLKHMTGLPAACMLPQDRIEAHIAPRNSSRELDVQAEAKLRKWYRADYEFFELCKDLAKQWATS